DERKRDRGLRRGRELALGFLGGFLEALQRHPVLAQVDARRLAEVVEQPVHDLLVEVLAAEVRVAGGGFDLVDPVAELNDRDLESASAEVVHRYGLAPFSVEAVGQGGRRGLIDDPEHLEAGNSSRVARGLALGVVEVRGYRYDGLADLLAERLLREFLDLREDEGRDFLGAVLPTAGPDLHVTVDRADDLVGQDLSRVLRLFGVELPADQPLDGEDRVHRICDRLPLGDLSDEALAVLGEAHDRGRRAAPLAVVQDLGCGAFDHRDTAVGRPEVDAEDFAHALASYSESGFDEPSAASSVRTATFTNAGRINRSLRK